MDDRIRLGNIERIHTYGTQYERKDCLWQPAAAAGCRASPSCPWWTGRGSQGPPTSRPSSLSPAPKTHKSPPCGSSPMENQNESLCIRAEIRIAFVKTGLIFSGVCCRGARPPWTAEFGHLVSWLPKLFLLCVGIGAVLKRLCRTTHGSKEAQLHFLSIVMDKTDRKVSDIFTFHLINLFQFSKKVTFSGNFMIWLFAYIRMGEYLLSEATEDRRRQVTAWMTDSLAAMLRPQPETGEGSLRLLHLRFIAAMLGWWYMGTGWDSWEGAGGRTGGHNNRRGLPNGRIRYQHAAQHFHSLWLVWNFPVKRGNLPFSTSNQSLSENFLKKNFCFHQTAKVLFSKQLFEFCWNIQNTFF